MAMGRLITPSIYIWNGAVVQENAKSAVWVCRGLLALPILHRPIAVPAIPTSNSYSKKTQSNNAENKRPEEETGRKASSTAKVPASPLPGLDRKKTTPTPSTVSHELLPQPWPPPVH